MVNEHWVAKFRAIGGITPPNPWNVGFGCVCSAMLVVFADWFQSSVDWPLRGYATLIFPVILFSYRVFGRAVSWWSIAVALFLEHFEYPFARWLGLLVTFVTVVAFRGPRQPHYDFLKLLRRIATISSRMISKVSSSSLMRSPASSRSNKT
jgi:hypothetical protein